MDKTMTLSCRNITKSFPLPRKDRKEGKIILKAVNDVSIDLRPGEIYGLLGPNGAGKTTFLRVLSTLIKPDSGTILLDDQDINKDISYYRNHIGFLTSEMKLDEFFTPDYTFTYMAQLHGLELNKIEERKKNLFSRFGIESMKNKKISELSTGMKQKAKLCISLAHDPDVIIFDEPTNGLDLVASRDVENYLSYLKEEGKIIIISTHIFSVVTALCQRVGILMNGVLKLDGYLDDLTKEKSLQDIFFTIYDKEKEEER